MNWVTILCSMIVASCLTVATVHLFVWLRARDAWTNFLLSDCALAAAVIVAFDVALMHSRTADQFAAILRWTQVALAWGLISVALFARRYLQAGRPWLLWTVVGTRLVAGVVNFVVPVNLNFREISALRMVPTLGEAIAVPVGTPNRWMLLGNASVVVFLVYLSDASVTAWRQGRRRQAALMGGILGPATLFALIRAMQFIWGNQLQTPYLISLVPLGFLVTVSYALSGDLLHANELARELRESGERMSQAQAELDRVSRLTAMGEFAAALAHEILQPLTAIILHAKSSLQAIPETASNLEDVRAGLRSVIEAGERAVQVTRRNRELFRYNTVRSAQVDVNHLIEETRVLAGRRLTDSGVNVATNLAADLPTVRGDRVELQQVLLNLIANAIDATESRPTRRVWIRSCDDAGGVRVEVGDNGVGLSGVDMRRMFTLSYTTKPSGTGVGLSVSRAIVDAHGGRIWGEQNPEGGATFYVRLPIEGRAEEQSTAALFDDAQAGTAVRT
jgi:signal transduction histidine kinase